MKIHSTNYVDTFIEVAEDTKVNKGTKPNSKCDTKTIAEMQFEILAENNYHYTSDDIIFKVFVKKNDLSIDEIEEERKRFFSKGQPCLRTSPLAKNFGYGFHQDSNGKVAIYGMETKEYKEFVADDNVKKIKAMRSSKK